MNSDTKPSNHVDELVGRSIRWRRREQGVSQARLAGRLGITFQQLQKYENGQNRISVGRLAQVALALDTPIESFFYGVEELQLLAIRFPEALNRQPRQASTEIFDLLAALFSLPDPAQRAAVIRMARSVAEAGQSHVL